MALLTVHQIFNNVAVTPTNAVPTGTLENHATEGEPGTTVVLHVFGGAAPTGTTPTLQFNIEVSADGTHWVQVAQGAVINAANAQQRITASNLVEPYIRINPIIGGTTPSFPGMTAYLAIG